MIKQFYLFRRYGITECVCCCDHQVQVQVMYYPVAILVAHSPIYED